MLPELPVFFSAVFSRSRLGQTMCCADQGRTLYHARHPRRLGPFTAAGNDRYRALLNLHSAKSVSQDPHLSSPLQPGADPPLEDAGKETGGITAEARTTRSSVESFILFPSLRF